MNDTHRKDLTLLEQAVLSHLYLHNVKDWRPFFLALNPNCKATDASLTKAVSMFRRSARVQQYWRVLEQLQPVQFARRQRTKDNETDLNKQADGVFSDGLKDYTDIQTFLDYCNDKVNKATNERDRQTYLKFIMDIRNLKNAANDAKIDIQRFFTPFQCSKCPGYELMKRQK